MQWQPDRLQVLQRVKVGGQAIVELVGYRLDDEDVQRYLGESWPMTWSGRRGRLLLISKRIAGRRPEPSELDEGEGLDAARSDWLRLAREHELLHRLQGLAVPRLPFREPYEPPGSDDDPWTEPKRLLMAYVLGPSLRDLADVGVVPSAAEHVRFSRSLAATITEISQRGVAHRDISPGQVIIPTLPSGTLDWANPVLVDFALGYHREVPMVDAHGDVHGTHTIGKVGLTPGFEPPEWWTAIPRVGPATDEDLETMFAGDVYGWAQVCAYAAGGRWVFGDGGTVARRDGRMRVGEPPYEAVMRQEEVDYATHPPVHIGDVPEEMRPAILAGLHPHPEQRSWGQVAPLLPDDPDLSRIATAVAAAVTTVEDDVRRLRAARDALTADVTRLRSERDRLRSDLGRVRLERDEARTTAKRLRSERDTATRRAEQLDAERDELEPELARMRTERNEARRNLDGVLKKRDAIEAELRHVTKTRDQLRADIRAIEADRTRLRNQRDAASPGAATTDAASVAALRAERDAAASAQERLEARMRSSSAKVASLTASLQAAENKIADLEAEVERLGVRNARKKLDAGVEIDRLRTELRVAQRDLRAATDERDRLRRASTASTTGNATTTARRSTSRAQTPSARTTAAPGSAPDEPPLTFWSKVGCAVMAIVAILFGVAVVWGVIELVSGIFGGDDEAITHELLADPVDGWDTAASQTFAAGGWWNAARVEDAPGGLVDGRLTATTRTAAAGRCERLGSDETPVVDTPQLLGPSSLARTTDGDGTVMRRVDGDGTVVWETPGDTEGCTRGYDLPYVAGPLALPGGGFDGDGSITAYSTETGEPVWRTSFARDAPVWSIGARDGAVYLTQGSILAKVSAEDGEPLWSTTLEQEPCFSHRADAAIEVDDVVWVSVCGEDEGGGYQLVDAGDGEPIGDPVATNRVPRLVGADGEGVFVVDRGDDGTTWTVDGLESDGTRRWDAPRSIEGSWASVVPVPGGGLAIGTDGDEAADGRLVIVSRASGEVVEDLEASAGDLTTYAVASVGDTAVALVERHAAQMEILEMCYFVVADQVGVDGERCVPLGEVDLASAGFLPDPVDGTLWLFQGAGLDLVQA